MSAEQRRPGRPRTLVGTRRRSFALEAAQAGFLERWRQARGLKSPSAALRDLLREVEARGLRPRPKGLDSAGL